MANAQTTVKTIICSRARHAPHAISAGKHQHSQSCKYITVSMASQPIFHTDALQRVSNNIPQSLMCCTVPQANCHACSDNHTSCGNASQAACMLCLGATLWLLVLRLKLHWLIGRRLLTQRRFAHATIPPSGLLAAKEGGSGVGLACISGWEKTYMRSRTGRIGGVHVAVTSATAPEPIACEPGGI